MHGRAKAPAAGTVVNALATGVGSAFAIDEYVHATVRLTDADEVRGEVAGEPDADAGLIERCVELAVDRFGDGQGGTVRTDSDVPIASGLKSSSAAANAAVLATLSALDVPVGGREDATGAALSRAEAARIGVRAARETGVTVTGAFDDASASMLGGVTVTDNDDDELLARDELDAAALVWTPPERAYSADADVERCRRVAPVAGVAADLALGGEYGRAMTVNGFAFCAALEFPPAPLLEALPDADGVSLSGTGPSYVALGDAGTLADVRGRWAAREGRTWLTTTGNEGARRT